jgi:CHAD domain-containing protein
MKRLKKFTHRQMRSLIRHLEKFRQNREPEIIHKIRVDVKKIKAITRILQACSPGYRKHKDVVLFRKIFRKTGYIRDADIMIELLSTYQVSGLQDDQLPSSESLMNALALKVPQFIKKVRKTGRKLESFSAGVRRRHFFEYLQGKQKQAKSHLFPLPVMSMIHQVRKDIKEVLYLSEIDKSPVKEIEVYEKIQDLIGKLHDKQVLLDRLQTNNTGINISEEKIMSACDADEKEISKLITDYYKHELQSDSTFINSVKACNQEH